MRLWTFHPKYLDPKGLVALWREGLLAQKVLRGLTSGYTAHPQLERFRRHPEPLAAIGFYLVIVHEEACARDYDFDLSKLVCTVPVDPIEETRGQVTFEWKHYLSKLKKRDPSRYRSLKDVMIPRAHPLFRIGAGEIRNWEKSGSSS